MTAARSGPLRVRRGSGVTTIEKSIEVDDQKPDRQVAWRALGGTRNAAWFAFTTLVEEPATVALTMILLLSIALDFGWNHRRSETLVRGPDR
jgi:hypothetical protein